MSTTPVLDRHYEVVDNYTFSETTKAITIDLETTSLSPDKGHIKLAAFTEDGINAYATTNFELLRSICADSNVTKIFHNAVFDVSYLVSRGFTVNGTIIDTMILASLWDSDHESLSLKYLANELLPPNSLIYYDKINTWLKLNKKTKGSLADAPQDILIGYACEDVCNTYDLCKIFQSKIAAMDLYTGNKVSIADLYFNEIMPLIPVLVRMNRRGVRLSLDSVAQTEDTLRKESAALYSKLPHNDYLADVEERKTEHAIGVALSKSKTGKVNKAKYKVAFNWNSGKHLACLIYDVLGYPCKEFTSKGERKLDEDTLLALVDKLPWILDLLQYRKTNKLLNTYVANLLELQVGGVIHPVFNITGTATGRFSSSGPNMQNLPPTGGIKRLFRPREGKVFLYADYSQIEYRLVTHLSEDPILLEAYNTGSDMHTATAKIVGCERSMAKTINFAIIYGAGAYRLKQVAGLKSLQEADELKDKLFSRYTRLAEYIESVKADIIEHKYISNCFGRVRRIPIKSERDDPKTFNHLLKAGFNFTPQSMGAQIAQRAMICLDDNGYNLITQVHDSIICEETIADAKNKLDNMKEIMENVYTLKVPLVAETKLLNSFDESDIYGK